jgi:hypothetical protein
MNQLKGLTQNKKKKLCTILNYPSPQLMQGRYLVWPTHLSQPMYLPTYVLIYE